MFLVDTSVWIEVFRKPTVFDLESVIPLDEVVTCLPVVQEVLQGFDDESAFRVARESMLALPIVEAPLTEGVYLEAVGLFRSARRQALTIRSGVDCLIAACALRNNLVVLHSDRDFEALARIAPLRVRRI